MFSKIIVYFAYKGTLFLEKEKLFSKILELIS